MRKLRILCLHGYHQNKDIFRQKTGSLRKPLKKYADFEFLNAPHLLLESFSDEKYDDAAYLNQNASLEVPSDGRGWWLKYAKPGESEGLKESLDVFIKTLVESGPFDGILGFSQGAAFLGLACILNQDYLSSLPIRFVICVAGFKSAMPVHSELYKVDLKVNIPSLHVIGESDQIISSERSKDLLEMFVNSQVVLHPGGHYVPAHKEIRDIYIKFIEPYFNSINT